MDANTIEHCQVILLARETVRAPFQVQTFIPTNTFAAKLTVLSSRINSLLSVYDVSDNNDGLAQSHTLPYSLSGCFPSGPHSGFCVVQPHLGYGNSMIGSLLQLSNRGAIYQSALILRQEDDQPPTKIELTWSPGVHRLNTDSFTQKPDVGRLGAREMQKIDFRQAYQRICLFLISRITGSKLCGFFLELFSPLDAAEPIYPAENADVVYQTLDAIPQFWKQANITDEHLLTMYA